MSAATVVARYNPCAEAAAWLGKRTPKQAWEQSPRGDWLLWIAARIGVDRKLVIRAACDCARTALKHVPKGEDRPRIAIETAERWCDGEATTEEVSKAYAYAAHAAHAAAAYAAASAASAAAAAHAAHAAHASAASAAAHAAHAYAASAAAHAAAYDAACAAYAADYADADAAYAAASTSARTKAQKLCAELVRKRIPWSVVKAAIEDAARGRGTK